MFGKLYVLGLGFVLFASGAAFSLAANFASQPCSRLESLPKGFDLAFNPCTIFSSLPGIGLLMQVLGLVVLAVALFFVVRSARSGFKCPGCGSKLKRETPFCPNCGAKLPQALEK